MNYERRFNEQLIINLSLNEDKQRILLELQNNNEISVEGLPEIKISGYIQN